MVEANPWWKNLPEGKAFPISYGSVGVKADGGGSMAGRGRVGPMRLHRAANLRDAAALRAALEAGDDANEVESVRTPRARCALLFVSVPRSAGGWCDRLWSARARRAALMLRALRYTLDSDGVASPLSGWQHAAA